VRPTVSALLARGVAVVSIDTELAWGEAHRRDDDAHRDYSTERTVIAAILELFTRYQIPATWALVGHLFLDRCAAEDGRPHPDVVRPEYPWLDGDWFDIDPCSTMEEAPAFYGRDIVAAIRSCPVEQEVGCHSFSHLIAAEPGCGAEAFGSDLDACRALAAADGLDLRSYVFPRNAIGHVAELGRHGFRSYRGRAATDAMGGFRRAVDRLRPLARSAAWPEREPSGVWNVPQTYLFAPATRGRRVPAGLWARRPRARLRLAARERSLFHLWFHPYNVTAAPERALRALEAICKEAARLRDAGRLDVLTMGALADRLDAGGRAYDAIAPGS
jgi:peptidoglycan/xylan/chitin deacetylase (PgdA/CDA1 family)